MTDKKILTTITKRLDRVIALLDSCYDTGEMSENTCRRLVEMLHTSITEIYSVGKQEENEFVDSPTVTTETTIIDEILQENETTKEESVEEIIEEYYEEKIVDEQPNEVAETNEVEKQVETTTEQLVAEEVNLNEANNSEQEKQDTITSIIDDTLIELESPLSLDYFEAEETAQNQPAQEETQEEVQEDIQEEEIKEEAQEQPDTEVEAAIQQADDIVTTELVVNVNNVDEEKLAKEKNQLADLRNQLEIERKRLEEELLSWQRERIKREEEMKAAEQLLAALESETQKRKTVINEAQPTKFAEATPVFEPVNVVVEPPIATTVTNNGKTTLGDKLQEKRQFLYDNFNNEDLITQGLTPITDLTKSIGINDKFQFIKELFGGDSDRYMDTIRTLNKFGNVEEAFNYIETFFNWDKNNDAVKRIVLLIRRRYM